MIKRNFLIASAMALCIAAPALADDMMKSDAKTYKFTAQNASGETGTVTLKPAGDDSTTVTIALTGAPAEAQPAHIHPGSCAKLDPKPKFPLTNVVDGKSTTTVKEPLSKLIAGGFAVNVHKSTNDLGTYVACADLGTMAMASPAPGKM
jgi:opacity protein-like surface antigen